MKRLIVFLMASLVFAAFVVDASAQCRTGNCPVDLVRVVIGAPGINIDLSTPIIHHPVLPPTVTRVRTYRGIYGSRTVIVHRRPFLWRRRVVW